MRALILMTIGAILIAPVLRRKKQGLQKPMRPALAAVAETSLQAVQDIYGFVVGTNYGKPTPISLALLAAAAAISIWIAGLIWYMALLFGFAATLCAGLRWKQIRRRRALELAESWPAYLEQTRAKMLTSSRSLPYVIFEQTSVASPFLSELIQRGRREFENSGNLEKALKTVWLAGDNEEVTNYICNALCATLGSTSSQIQNQLSAISGTVRSRNELKQETNSRLSGVRTARIFILVIPAGMALAGLSFAGSVKPFLTAASISQILAALLLLATCWYWSTKLMHFPAWPTQVMPNTNHEPQEVT